MASSNSPCPPQSSCDDGSKLPRIDYVEMVASTKWLALKTIDYTDQQGAKRKWDVAVRTTKQPGQSADAVVIVALLKDPSDSSVLDTLIVEQFRPPVGRTTVEFPAGLIDTHKDCGETPEQAALRELREETGYVGEACKVLPQVSRPVCMSPGVTDETVHIVVVEVDLSNPYNRSPKQQLDDGEHVVVKRVSLRDGIKLVLDSGTGMPIEGLYLFALGLDIGINYQQQQN